MSKKLLVQIFVLSAFVLSFLNFTGDPGQRIPQGEKSRGVNGNNFTTGAPQLNPIFIDSFGPESFENPAFPPTGWSRFTAAANVIMWDRILSGALPPGWNPGFGIEATVPPGGGTAVAYATYDAVGPIVNDIWLVTPRIYNINLTDSIVFWVSKKAAYADNLDIKISKTVNNSAPAFNITVALLSYGATNNDSAWVRKAYSFSGLSGLNNGDSIYIGFREHVTNNLNDGAVIYLDLVQGVGSLVMGTGNSSDLSPDKFGLAQNYPNPFNPSTTIFYNVPKSGNVNIKVYDVLGNEVATLVNEVKIAGMHRAIFNASNLASGIYFYKMTAGSFTDVKKMTLIK